jgi:hypothetical protein
VRTRCPRTHNWCDRHTPHPAGGHYGRYLSREDVELLTAPAAAAMNTVKRWLAGVKGVEYTTRGATDMVVVPASVQRAPSCVLHFKL